MIGYKGEKLLLLRKHLFSETQVIIIIYMFIEILHIKSRLQIKTWQVFQNFFFEGRA